MELDYIFVIKFAVLSIPLIIMMWFFAPTLKWKLVFSLAVPIGVGLALAGKSMKGLGVLSGRI